MTVDEPAVRAKAHAYFVSCAMHHCDGLRATTFDALVRQLIEAGGREELMKGVVFVIDAYVDTARENPGLCRALPPREVIFEVLRAPLDERRCDLLDEDDWDNLLLLLESKLFHANVPVAPSLQRHSNLELIRVDPLMFELEHLF